MITEQRLRFEATNEVPKGVVYNPNTDWYESVEQEGLPELLRDGPGAYNMKYQGFKEGYQSALEDRQGEAVAWMVAKRNSQWGMYTTKREADYWKMHAGPDFTVTPLFTSPQPAQPDQWNAAIEAAAELATHEDQDWMARKILALRKGA